MSIRMRNIKDMLAKMKDGSCESVSSIPIKLNHLNVIVSILAPQFYTEQQLSQLQSFSNLETAQTNMVAEVTSKKRSRSYQTEQICQEETSKERTKKLRTTTLPIAAIPPPPPQLPDIFMERIARLNGSDMKFLMHKKLCLSDVLQNNNRLSMPKSKIACEFLTDNEKEKLNERKEDSRGRLVGMEIIVMDPCLREYKMTLKKWEMKKKPEDEDDEMKGMIYNLVTNWHNVVDDNKFKINQELDIWSFRVDGKLYVLLNDFEHLVSSQDLEYSSTGHEDADYPR